MASKIANQYSGIVPDDDATESSSPVLQIGEIGDRSNDVSGPATCFSNVYSESKKLAIAIIVPVIIIVLFLLLVLILRLIIKSTSYSTSPGDVHQKDVYQKDVYYPLTGKGGIGHSAFLAILLYKHEKSDAMFGHIPHVWVGSEEPFLLVDQITRGVGISELFWDPGSVVSQDLVLFEIVGESKLIMLAPQQKFRGSKNSEKCFSNAVLWFTDIIDRDEYGFIIDLTSLAYAPSGFAHSDSLSNVIKNQYGLTYARDFNRSSVHLPGCQSGPKGTSIEIDMTYALQDGQSGGRSIKAPIDTTISVSFRRTFLKLEKVPKYTARMHHPKSGFNSITYENDTESFLRPRDTHSITRHHLKILDPNSGLKPFIHGENENENTMTVTDKLRGRKMKPDKKIKENTKTTEKGELELPYMPGKDIIRHPSHSNDQTLLLKDSTAQELLEQDIVRLTVHGVKNDFASPQESDESDAQLLYMVDRTAPLAVQIALVEGVKWWDEAFQYAGFPPNTFQARVAGPDFDPHNVTDRRVHFVEWIDRDVRSYSVGIRISDPRTGQILRGHARIESLRLRQDAVIAEALLGPYIHPNGSADSVLEQSIMVLLMQRMRTLGAHEVGHTLGLAHNFAGSTYRKGAASVMDYPSPIVTLSAEGDLILSDATYAGGIGFFDKVAINYGYRVFTEMDENPLLERLIDDAEAEGYMFLTDQDSAASEGDWRDTPWDVGSDPVRALQESLAVRAVALSKLGERSIPGGYPLSGLLEALPPIFLWHRYEVVASAKLLGGFSFAYTVRGDRATKAQQLTPIPGSMQRKALHMLIKALEPASLALPPSLYACVLPQAFGYTSVIGGKKDLFGSRTGALFDRYAATESAAYLVTSAVFCPERAERLATQRALNSSLPSFFEVMQAFSTNIILNPYKNLSHSSITKVVAEEVDENRNQGPGYSHDTVHSDRIVGAVGAIMTTAQSSDAQYPSETTTTTTTTSTSAAAASAPAYLLESFIAQSMVVDSYLTLLVSPLSSNLVKSQVKAHLHDLNAMLVKITKGFEDSNNSTSSTNNFHFENEGTTEVRAHLMMLCDRITLGKPFLTLLATPLGPPI